MSGLFCHMILEMLKDYMFKSKLVEEKHTMLLQNLF